MAISIFVFSIIFFTIPMFSIQIDHALDIHYRYMLERSIQSAILASYQALDSSGAYEQFTDIFFKLCPKNFEYHVILKNFETHPKMVQFKVSAISDVGLSYELEETIIEEDLDGNHS